MNKENQKSIRQLTVEVLAELKRQSYAESTLNRYRSTYNKLIAYTEQNGISFYSEAIGLGFMEQEYGYRLEGFFGKVSPKATDALHHLMLLWHYQEYETVGFVTRNRKRGFVCPLQYERHYSAFLAYCGRKQYSMMGMLFLLPIAQKFLIFLDAQRIRTPDEITQQAVNLFFSSYADRSVRYLATIASTLRSLLRLWRDEGLITLQIDEFIPNVRYSRNAFIPPSWKKEDVLKLLDAIDRGSPVGKRNYAILMLVVRLGLRASDIKTLEMGNLDWNRKQIVIIQSKTKKRLELPLLDDVGWAIIDYLRNGRPKTNSPAVFINHKAPYGAFKMTNSMQHILYKYMRIANIEIPRNEHCGLHSLRSTLARTMLEVGTPLPVISEVLGHQSVQTTAIYLKINLDALRRCPIDPDEVFCHE